MATPLDSEKNWRQPSLSPYLLRQNKRRKAMKPKKDRIYISGSISGRPLEQARSHFAAAECRLRKQGNATINPLKMRFPVWLARHGCYRACLLIELVWLAYRATAIYMLDGYSYSPGAKVERKLAQALGLPIIYEHAELMSLSPEERAERKRLKRQRQRERRAAEKARQAQAEQ